MPDIDHTTTLRANILRDSLNRSQTRLPIKPRPLSSTPQLSSQGHGQFLGMVWSYQHKGFPVASQPPGAMDNQVDEVGEIEGDVTSTKTQESSIADAEVIISPGPTFLIIYPSV